jgi:two-component system, OmpR family, phosphate regulon response regulator PhoB
MTEESTRAVVLVVEDDPRVRELLTEVLSDEGYDVIPAANGEEALTTVTTVWPSLITLDLDLPGISGATILQALREQHETRELPVVIVSAKSHIAANVRELAQAVVSKPFELDDLIAIIRSFVPPPKSGTDSAETESA